MEALVAGVPNPHSLIALLNSSSSISFPAVSIFFNNVASVNKGGLIVSFSFTDLSRTAQITPLLSDGTLCSSSESFLFPGKSLQPTFSIVYPTAVNT